MELSRQVMDRSTDSVLRPQTYSRMRPFSAHQLARFCHVLFQELREERVTSAHLTQRLSDVEEKLQQQVQQLQKGAIQLQVQPERFREAATLCSSCVLIRCF
jgi:hypothetical protein